MKILMIGPFPLPITGVSLANQVLFNGLEKVNVSVKKIDSEFNNVINSEHGKISFKKFKIIKAYLNVYKILNTDLVYITIGQSFYGVVKYLPFILVTKLLNKKCIVHLHGGYLYEEYKTLSKIKKIIFYNTIKMFNYGIVLSNTLRSNLDNFLPSKNVFSLNNFYQNYLKVNEDLILKKDFSTIKMVYLSNLIEEKGINNLLKAKKVLSQKGINFQLIIAGSKVLNNNLDNELNNNNIKYLGNVDGVKKKELLLWSNVFCLPTFYKMEGQPISILESMATGNIILTTKHAGIVDVCSENNALFCLKNDVQDLVKKIEYLYNNTHIIKEKAIYNYYFATKEYTEIDFVQNAITIFKKCMN